MARVRAALVSLFDRYLPFLVFAAMALGGILGASCPGLSAALVRPSVGAAPLPLALLLFLMVAPVYAAIPFGGLPTSFKTGRLFLLVLVESTVIGPGLVFLLAALCLRARPDWMAGVVLVGLARGVARLPYWSERAEGRPAQTAALTAFHAIFQSVLYAVFAYVFVDALPQAFEIAPAKDGLSLRATVLAVILFGTLPFLSGGATGFALRSADRAEPFPPEPPPDPVAAPARLVSGFALLAVVAAVFAAAPLRLDAAIPLVLGVVAAQGVLMYVATFLLAAELNASYDQAAPLALSAASLNFELGLAVAVGLFGAGHPAARAAALGLLVETPLMALFVRSAFWFKRRLFGLSR